MQTELEKYNLKKLNRCGEISDLQDHLQVAIYQILDGYDDKAQQTLKKSLLELRKIILGGIKNGTTI